MQPLADGSFQLSEARDRRRGRRGRQETRRARRERQTMNLTAANQLTILRMLIIPGFVILLLYGYRGWRSSVLHRRHHRPARRPDRPARGPEDHARRLARSDGRQAAARDDVRDADAAGNRLGRPDCRCRSPYWSISRDVAIVLTVAVVNLAVGPRTFRPSIYGKIATATFVCTGVVDAVFQLPRAPVGDRDRRCLRVARDHRRFGLPLRPAGHQARALVIRAASPLGSPYTSRAAASARCDRVARSSVLARSLRMTIPTS